MITVENLTKKFPEIIAIDSISFHVKRGEVLGLLGPNGAGKTTTMRILSCFIPATSGSAQVAGYDVFTHSLEARKKVGYMPENIPLYPGMRVEEYLKFIAQLKKVPGNLINRKVADVIEQCWLGEARTRLIGHLSKGYRQRVGLANALVHNPEVLILDEPTIGLDPNQIRQVRLLIRELGGGHTILLSTHILPEVEAVCGRVIIVDKGKLIAVDTPENLVKQLRDTATLFLEIRGSKKAVKEAIGSLEGIEEAVWESEGTAKDDINRLTVRALSSGDIRERIFKAVVSHKCILREMRSEHMSLEDIFVQLTTQEREEP